MSRRPMLELVQEGLAEAARRRRLRELARQADVTYEWLVAVRQGKIIDPGITRLQRLFDVLYPEAG